MRSSVISTLLVVPISLLYVPFVLDRLELEVYGVWATVSALLLLSTLADGGVGTEISRRVAEASGRDDREAETRAVREGMTVLAFVGAAVACAGFVFSGPVTRVVFAELDAQRQAEVRLLLLAVVLQLSVSLVLSAYFAVLLGLQRTDFGAYGALVGQLLTVTVGGAGLVAGYGLAALYAGNLAGALFGWTILYFGVRRCRPQLRLRFSRVSPKRAASYFGLSAVVVLANLSNVVDFQLDKVLLSRYAGSAAAGSYQIGTSLAIQARSVALIPIGFLMAGTAALYATDRPKLARLEHLLGTGTPALAALLLGGVIALSPAFVPLWLGASYATVTIATQLLALALLMNAWTAPWYYYAIGRGWYADIGISAAGNALVNGTASFLLTREFGLVGALVGSLLGNGFGVLLFWFLLLRRERRPRLRQALRPALVLAPLVAVVLALQATELNWAQFVGAGMLWLLVGGGLLLLTRVVPVRVQRSGRRLTVELVQEQPG